MPLVLFQDILCPEKKRPCKIHSGPFSPQQDVAHSIIQNGDDREDCQERVRVPVGLLNRSHRCLPSCSNSMGVSQVLCIRSGQSDFRLPVSSLWAVPSSLGIFKGDEAHQGLPAQEGNVGVFVPGRFFNLANSPQLLRLHTMMTLELLQKLGFLINWEKSSLFPLQKLEYLGVMLDLQNITLSLPQDKVEKIVEKSLVCYNKSLMSRRNLEQLVGLLNFAAAYIP